MSLLILSHRLNFVIRKYFLLISDSYWCRPLCDTVKCRLSSEWSVHSSPWPVTQVPGHGHHWDRSGSVSAPIGSQSGSARGSSLNCGVDTHGPGSRFLTPHTACIFPRSQQPTVNTTAERTINASISSFNNRSIISLFAVAVSRVNAFISTFHTSASTFYTHWSIRGCSKIIWVILIFFALKATALLCVSVKCSCLLCLKSILIRQLWDISWTTFANVTFTMQLNLQVLYLTIRYWHSKDKSFWWFLKIDSTFDSSCHDQLLDQDIAQCSPGWLH